MPEHVHLLVSEPTETILAQAIQALKLSVSVKQGRTRFWQKRYYDFNVYTEDKRVEKLRYIHRNPVTCGLVAQPEDWNWSSFRRWKTGECRIVTIGADLTSYRSIPTSEAHVSEARRGAPDEWLWSDAAKSREATLSIADAAAQAAVKGSYEEVESVGVGSPLPHAASSHE
jgi:putative transposase